MSESEYRIAIVHRSGDTVILYPGSTGERDLVVAVADAAVKKGVGVFRTQAQVRRAIEQAFNEVLFALKKEVVP